MKKILFLFTVNYPFSHGEHLLEYEINYLLEQFDEIVLICSDTDSKQYYNLNSNVNVIRYHPNLNRKDIIFSCLSIFDKRFVQELIIIRNTYQLKLSFKIIKRLLLYIQKGNKVFRFLKKLIVNYEPKVNKLYFYSWWSTEMTLGFAKLKQKYPDFKVVTRARAIDLYFERHKTNYLPMRNYIYSMLDKIFCISDNGKKYIENKFYNKEINKKIIISRVGSVNRFPYTLNYQNNIEKVLISCSNIIPLKRIDLIIMALEIIENTKIKWIHFGMGESEEELLKLAEEKLRHKNNISFSFYGYINNNDLLNFYKKNYVDLFINVSEYEGIPVTIMEAMSYGIPVIATDVGGVSEIVNDENGFLLPKVVSHEFIGNTINKYLMLNHDNQNKYRISARKTWEKEYNSDNNFKVLANIITSLK